MIKIANAGKVAEAMMHWKKYNWTQCPEYEVALATVKQEQEKLLKY